ncbi:hypothetical protein RJ639_004334 [Escallonia herrerae]|uniref:Fatty acid hydroxylase domain-containing protein n=1 Tax=Escallonia herrerae TaxID=1293975 RepID=A0AA88W430_9ASTE|nr:hypothetical protein RJ639_004334 [Escallonia herrerae]
MLPIEFKAKLQGAEMVVAQDFIVDLNKPLVFQVGYLGEAYQEWVHQPIVSKEGPRFFEISNPHRMVGNSTDLAPSSMLVRLHVFKDGPFTSSDRVNGCIWHFYMDIARVYAASFPIPHQNKELLLRKLLSGETPFIILFTVVIINIPWMGYALFSLLLQQLFSYSQRRLYTNVVGYLLLLLTLSPLHNCQFWNLVKLMSNPSMTPALFGGGLLGYVMYDVTHYYLHHGQPTSEVPRNLKRYHLNHHFRIQNKGFGITSSLWDKAFGTLPQTKSAEKSDQLDEHEYYEADDNEAARDAH